MFSVSVPVVSEQMTDIAPSVSTVLSNLQSTLFLRIMLALRVRLAVSATGRQRRIFAVLLYPARPGPLPHRPHHANGCRWPRV